MTIESHQKHLLLFSGLVALCLVLICFIIQPAMSNIKNNNTEIKYQKERLVRLLLAGQNINKNRENLAIIQSEIDILDKIFLHTGEELKFITDLETIAAENNLKQIINFDNTKTVQLDKIGQGTFEPLEEIYQEKNFEDFEDMKLFDNQQEEKIKAIALKLEITGNLANTISYINTLEMLDYYININKIDINSAQRQSSKKFPGQLKPETEEQTTNLSVRLDALTYWK